MLKLCIHSPNLTEDSFLTYLSFLISSLILNYIKTGPSRIGLLNTVVAWPKLPATILPYRKLRYGGLYIILFRNYRGL